MYIAWSRQTGASDAVLQLILYTGGLVASRNISVRHEIKFRRKFLFHASTTRCLRKCIFFYWLGTYIFHGCLSADKHLWCIRDIITVNYKIVRNKTRTYFKMCFPGTWKHSIVLPLLSSVFILLYYLTACYQVDRLCCVVSQLWLVKKEVVLCFRVQSQNLQDESENSYKKS
jgi:hypothetical protein